MAENTNKILVAEDDPFLIKVLGTVLQDEGYQVDKANNGDEAINMIKKNSYKLVLLDMIMPKKTGFEVLEEVQKQNIKTPILVFSNLSQKTDKEEALGLGAKDYFVKSDMSVDDIAKIVNEYIK